MIIIMQARLLMVDQGEVRHIAVQRAMVQLHKAMAAGVIISLLMGMAMVAEAVQRQ